MPLSRVTSPLIKAKLPADDVFGTSVPVAYSVADGWVAEALRLPVGGHTIVVTVSGTDPFGNPVGTVATNTVIITGRPPVSEPIAVERTTCTRVTGPRAARAIGSEGCRETARMPDLGTRATRYTRHEYQQNADIDF